MKPKTLHYLFILAMAGISLAGCKSDVNLGEVSVDSKVNARLSLPIGEVSTKFADLIGLIGAQDQATVTINDRGIIELSIDQHHERDFHKIELKDYIGTVENDKTIQSINPDLAIIPQNTEVMVPFDMSINFSGINDDMHDERLDSLVIEEAEFTTRISTNNLTITDADIQNVTIVLGSQFRRAKGTRIDLPDFHLDQDVLIKIDDFTLVMMADETLPPSNTNVVSKANITFEVTLKTGENVIIAANSGFHFKFQVEMMEYSALYGYFSPGSQTYDDGSVDVPIKIPSDEPVVLPVKDPVINMKFTYGMSIPLDIFIKEISATHSDNTQTFALWDGGKTTTKPLNRVLPVDAPLDSTVSSTVTLDKDPVNGGSIDRFFLKEIKSLGYDYELQIDNGKASSMNMKQFRLTKNTNFILDFNFIMPFEFNPGLNVAYADTIKDVNLERASLDSLAAMTNGMITSIDKAELSLYIVVNNNIPVDMTLDAIFLDEHNNELQLDQLKGIEIEGATMSGSQVTAAKSVKTVAIHTEDFDEIAKTKAIRFRARIGDDQKPSTFLADQKLSIKLGVTGDVQAVLNLELKKNNN